AQRPGGLRGRQPAARRPRRGCRRRLPARWRGRRLTMAPPADELRRPLERLPDPLPIPPLPPLPPTPSGGRRIQIRPPGSKSLTNRALLLAALAAGRTEIRRPLLGADDTDRMMMALRSLGARIAVGGDALTVEGVGGRWRPHGP